MSPTPDSAPDSSPFDDEPRKTMPPPELLDRAPPASVSQIVLSHLYNEPPLLRHAGPRAELAYQFSRAALASRGGDKAGEREAYLAIAKLLTARGTELDTATAAARRALSLGDDAAVRAELGSWLSWLGEPALAAAALRGIEAKKPQDAEKNLLRIAILLGRAGDAPGAADALHEAASLASSEPMAHELLAMLASWAPEDVSPETAATSYGEAAKRRIAANDPDAAFEDLLRAFEIAPGHAPAASALAAAVTERAGAAVADEVLREHAAVVAQADPERSLSIHRERMRKAMADGDAARAVGALLDAWLDGDVGGESAEEVDAALISAELGEVAAARLEVYAAEHGGEARASAYLALGKLCQGTLASPDRAAEAWGEAFVTDPRLTEALTLLTHHADETHDPWPLVEALVRIGMTPHPTYSEPNQGAARVAALQELSALAEDRLADPYLAAWALRRLVEAGSSAGVGARLDRLSPRLRLQEDAFEQALGRLAAAEAQPERLLTLRRALAFYRGRPDESETYFKLSLELQDLAPTDPSAAQDLIRAAGRAEKEIVLIEVLRGQVAARAGRDTAGHSNALLHLCSLLRRQGDESVVLAELAKGLAELEVHDAVAGAALVHACRLRAPKERAEALGMLAGTRSPAIAAVLLAVAADLWMVAADVERALATTRRALRANAESPRAAVTYAVASLNQRGPDSVAAVEEAMMLVVPRGVFCNALAASLEDLGERELALAWTQRWLALRPSSPEASEALLRRAYGVAQPQAMADALSAVLSQPRPPGMLADLVADMLDALLELDKAKAVALAKRTLDIFGPRLDGLRARLLGLAERAGDSALAITILERWNATGLAGEEAAAAAMDLALRRARGSDFAAAARLFARAAAAGYSPDAVLEAVEPLIPEVKSRLAEATPAAGAALSDALVSLAEARALALASSGAKPEDTSTAYRIWGGLLWDLAQDPAGAEEAFYQASGFVADGVVRYARDLHEFAGGIGALDAIEERAASLAGDPANDRLRASLLIELAIGAHDAGLEEKAMAFAAGAIEIDPSRSDAIVLVERSSHVPGGIEALDQTYVRLAATAFGRYGRRAAHYRAARQMERRGAMDLALRHAIESFEALPSEGSTFVALSRLAERSADPSDAVRSLLRVADECDPKVRHQWLKRAAGLTGRSEEGLRLRFDILLRALLARPDLSAITDVSAVLRDLVAVTGDHDTPALRLDRALRALLSKLDGPDGARAGVGLARMAIESLRDLPLAISAIERAFEADGDVEDFLSLLDLLPAFEAEPEHARKLVATVTAAANKPYSSIGPSLLRFTSTLAGVLRDAPAAATLLIEAARRAPEDDDLVQKADAAVAALGSEELTQVLDRAVPRSTRIDTLLRVAEKAEPAGRDATAIKALLRVLALEPEGAENRERLVAWLRRLFAMLGKPEAIQELLQNELKRSDLRTSARVRYGRDLGAILSGRGQHAAALDVLAGALTGASLEPDSLSDLQRFARRARDPKGLRAALDKLRAAAPDDSARETIEHELASLSDAPPRVVEPEGPPSEIRAALDAGVLEAMEQEANLRGDHASVADFLEKRIAIAEVPDVRRMLRLRRAAVLEQRLGRMEDAGAELLTQLNETPDDVIALRYLGDMRERAGDPLGAAELWERLARIAPTIDEKADYGIRTTTDLIAGGDLVRARETLERFASIAPRESVIELRAQIARQEGDLAGLAEALDQLGSSSRESPARRAELLIEAGRASAAAGDDIGALDRARRALKLSPDWAEAILETLRAEYRMRGAGTPREAQAATAELQRIAERVPDEHIDLHAFLLAEEMDVIQGGGAGMRELSRRHAEVGALPLIALGMAERLMRSKTFGPAAMLFETALAGELRGLRSRGRVAISAAEAASASGDDERAHALLQIAIGEPDTRTLALRREAELLSGKGLTMDAPLSRSAPFSTRSGPMSGRAAPPPLPPPLPPPEPPPAEEASPISEEPPSASVDELDAPDMGDFATQIAAAIDFDAIAAQAARDVAAPEAPAQEASPEPPPAATSQPPAARTSQPPGTTTSQPPPARTSQPPRPPLPIEAPGRVVVAEVSHPESPDEAVLRRELLAGSFQAGDQLIAIYAEHAAARTRDILAVRRQQASIRSGDLIALSRLHEAAAADGNTPFANAVEHVLGVFDSAGGLTPPPLSAQRDAPALVSQLLFRQADSAVNEALAIVWETSLYRRDVASYGLTGVERVQPNATTQLGETFTSLLRLFGLGRIWLFHRRTPGPVRAEVVLLASPAVVLSGEISQSDNATLLYTLGSNIIGGMPEHALVNGMPEDDLRSLIDALIAAFGPLDVAPRGNRAVVRLEQSLWQLIPPRAERRLREICAHPDDFTFEAALRCTRQAMRRAGLFASGSLSTAVRQVAEESGYDIEPLRMATDGLERACLENPEIADLVRLAIRTEYAEARWLPPRPEGPESRRSRHSVP